MNKINLRSLGGLSGRQFGSRSDPRVVPSSAQSQHANQAVRCNIHNQYAVTDGHYHCQTWLLFNWPTVTFLQLLLVMLGIPKVSPKTLRDCQSKVFTGQTPFLSTNKHVKALWVKCSKGYEYENKVIINYFIFILLVQTENRLPLRVRFSRIKHWFQFSSMSSRDVRNGFFKFGSILIRF